MYHLHELIADLSFRRGAFTLASGRSSTYFFDLKPTMLHPLGANLIGQAVLDIVDQFEVDAIGGLVVGAVPLVAATVTLSHHKRPVRGFYVRKEAKDHGTAQLIDGLDVAGLTVILLEDVTTTGGSLLKAAAVQWGTWRLCAQRGDRGGSSGRRGRSVSGTSRDQAAIDLYAG